MLPPDIGLLVRDIANKIIKDLQRNIREKAPTSFGPMNNTGEAANSLRWKIDNGNLVIYSTMAKSFNHIMTLETGRKPGKMPWFKDTPTEEQPIFKWVQQRGINPSDISQESLAYLIARKIGREGTQVYQDYTATGKGTGIILDIVGNREYIQETVVKPISSKLADIFINQFQYVGAD